MLCVMVSYSVVTLNLAQLCSIIGVVTATCTIGQVLLLVYYIKLKSRLSVCLSDRHDDNSVVPAWIDAGLARRDGYVFRYLIVHF